VFFSPTDYEVEGFIWRFATGNRDSGSFGNPSFFIEVANGVFSDAAREECRKDALRYYNAVSRTTQFLDGTAKSNAKRLIIFSIFVFWLWSPMPLGK
jgi:hypothetical protein